MISTVIGRNRSARCPEIVVTVCMDPLKADPQSMLLSKTLSNARRLLQKSEERRAEFIKDATRIIQQDKALEQVHVGPVKGVLEVCTKWAIKTLVTQDDIILQPRYGPSINLFCQSKRQFTDGMRNLARQHVWEALAAQMKGEFPRRKDFHNMSEVINVSATMATSKVKQLPTDSLDKCIWKQLHLTLVTGATVAGDRLKAMQMIDDDICPLDGCRHTTEHFFWECSAFAMLRRNFLLDIGKILGAAVHEGPAVSEYIQHVYAATEFRCAGLVPADTNAMEFAAKRSSKIVHKPPVHDSMLLKHVANAKYITRGGVQYMLVFTDGSVKMQKHPWLAHGGWGLHVAPAAEANDHGILECGPYNSYRAELRALVEAVSRATVPICVVIDNEAVCDGARSIIDEIDSLEGQERSEFQPSNKMDYMWKYVAEAVKAAPRSFYRTYWVPSHLLEEGKEERLEQYLQGGGDKEMLIGNQAADSRAGMGASLDAPPPSAISKDKLVTRLAKKVQCMQILVWAAFKGYIPSDQEIDATKLQKLDEEEQWDICDEWHEIDDPALAMFLEQTDVPREAHEDVQMNHDKIEQETFDATDLPRAVPDGCPPIDEECQKGGVNERLRTGDEEKVNSEKNASTIVKARTIRATIVQTAAQYPFVIQNDHVLDLGPMKMRLRGNATICEVLMDITLGKATLGQPGQRKRLIPCQLAWIEPFMWAMTQLRWTEAVGRNMNRVDIRKRTCSWLELALIVFTMTKGAAAPIGTDFATCAAVTKKLWISASKFLAFENTDGTTVRCKAVMKQLRMAGAAAECGICGQSGLNRRPITDDFLMLAVNVAALIQYASEHDEKLSARIPMMGISAIKWQPTGLQQIIQQVRQTGKEKIKTDVMQYKGPIRTKKKAREGPCIFGCLGKVSPSQNGALQWYAVPNPSPWPGIQPGEVLCKKCYTWSRQAPNKSKKRKIQDGDEPPRGFQIGQKIVVRGLYNNVQYNGREGTVITAVDDNDKQTIRLGDGGCIRLCIDKMESDGVAEEESETTSAEAPGRRTLPCRKACARQPYIAQRGSAPSQADKNTKAALSSNKRKEELGEVVSRNGRKRKCQREESEGVEKESSSKSKEDYMEGSETNAPVSAPYREHNSTAKQRGQIQTDSEDNAKEAKRARGTNCGGFISSTSEADKRVAAEEGTLRRPNS